MPPRISGTYIPNPQYIKELDESLVYQSVKVWRHNGNHQAQCTDSSGVCETVVLTPTEVSDFQHLILAGRIQKVSKYLLTPEGL